MERLINEDVSISSVGKKNNKNVATLSYSKNRRNKKVIPDFLKTDKMESNDEDTYVIPLKNGLNCYNITSINGTNVMHYFKNYFQNKKTDVAINNDNYELQMENNEFNEFLSTFISKVAKVITYYTDEIKKKNPDIDFTHISIFPVPSSSNFNTAMTNEIIGKTCANLPIRKVDEQLLRKDTSNIAIDQDFVDKNSNYYNSKRNNTAKEKETHINALKTGINNLKIYPEAKQAVADADKAAEELIDLYHRKTVSLTTPKRKENWIKRLYSAFCNYQNAIGKIKQVGRYYNETTEREQKIQLGLLTKAIKYTKGPSVISRTNEIWDYVKPYMKNSGLYRHTIEDVCRWEPLDFQIKRLGNDVRMGLKNYFQSTDDENLKQEELKKIEGGVVVVFDDNVAGGATLSDICYQFQQMGIKFIIPITFGKMATSWNLGTYLINKPEGGDFIYEGKPFKINLQELKYIIKGVIKEVAKKNTPISSKPNLRVLWLDDKREPYRYFKEREKEISNGKGTGTGIRNTNFYNNNIFNKYNVIFEWVHNIEEFSDYIKSNGMPEFISFDRDLTPNGWSKTHDESYPDGLACIKWLKNYCKETNQPMPKCFIHSANAAKIPEMEAELGTAALK